MVGFEGPDSSRASRWAAESILGAIGSDFQECLLHIHGVTPKTGSKVDIVSYCEGLSQVVRLLTGQKRMPSLSRPMS